MTCVVCTEREGETAEETSPNWMSFWKRIVEPTGWSGSAHPGDPGIVYSRRNLRQPFCDMHVLDLSNPSFQDLIRDQ